MKQRRCRLCVSHNLIELIDLHSQPIAHRFLESPSSSEELFPLSLLYCTDCGLGQIPQPIDPELLYRKYNFCFSSWKTEHHIEQEIQTLNHTAELKNVFEIACNEGVFLDALRKHNPDCRYIGLEPNEVTSRIARDRGFEVIEEMLTVDTCRQIVERFGKFDTVIARQVLEHLTALDNFFKCVDVLLSDNGHLFIDIPDFEIGLKMGDCSVIWEEHVNYFTEPVVSWALRSQGFRVLEVKRYNFSGGVMSLLAQRSQDVAAGVSSIQLEPAKQFGGKVEMFGEGLRSLLAACKSRNLAVILYGVGCRACTLVNGLDLGELVDYAIDDQPERQGMYMPGSRLGIYAPIKTQGLKGPIICQLAVNMENELTVKQRLSDINANVVFVSVLSPSDICSEIEKIAGL